MATTKTRDCAARRCGFTLVELLVVIGIIALLIAILLPSLATARRSAQRVACSVKLQQMLVAANVHAAEHKGYYPVCGSLQYCDPMGLDDRMEQRYDYGRFDTSASVDTLQPITFALARYMGFKDALLAHDNVTIARLENDPRGLIRNFMCPGQAESPIDLNFPILPLIYFGYTAASGGLSTCYDNEAMSYVFNEQVLGIDDGLGRRKGNSTAIQQPAKTMFACDGLPSSINNDKKSSFYGTGGWIMMTMYGNYNIAPITMGDAFSGRKVGGVPLAGDPNSFDKIRHRGKINIAFCDGHVESRDINYKDLQRVYLMAQ